MTVSFDDAFELLNKWKNESTLITGMLTAEGVAVTFGGLITGLEPSGFVVSQYLKPDWKVLEVLVGLKSTSSFEYQDLREAPPNIREKFEGKIAALLKCELPTSTCCLYEMESTTT